MSSGRRERPLSVTTALYRTMIPAIGVFMIVVTGVAVVLGWRVFSAAFGDGHLPEVIREYFWIIFWTGLTEGVCLFTGIFLLRRLAASFNRLFAAQDARLRELRNLTTNVLHDLRTPLTQIRCDAEAICRGEVDATEAAERTMESCHTIIRLIDTNAEITRTNAGIQPAPAQDLDFRDIVSESIELFRPAADMKSVDLVAHLPEEVLPLRGHPDRFQRIVGNLIDNAIKFTGPGGSVLIELSSDDSRIVLSVADTGIGMPPETASRVFERFYRADESRHEPGFGLGLSLVKAIVDSYNGTIRCSTKPGKGTAFTVELPRRI